MWTSSQMKESGGAQRHSAALGVVTAAGAENGVYLGTERRWLPVMAPGGYRWRPRAGDQVLVLKAGTDGESPCVLARQVQEDDTLLPGEVELAGTGCSVKLTEKGEVVLRGTVRINGTTLEDMIQTMVAAALAGQGG